MNNGNESKRGTDKNTGRHVLVIGGGLAGLFAARVLADFFDKFLTATSSRYHLTTAKAFHNRIVHIRCFRRLSPFLSGSFPVS